MIFLSLDVIIDERYWEEMKVPATFVFTIYDELTFCIYGHNKRPGCSNEDLLEFG